MKDQSRADKKMANVKVNNQYVIKEKIGAGSFGQVFKGNSIYPD